ncbi:MAG: DUF996 domain-containing protein [Archaeoglobaceae archaeon]|nr:DUF996 domain-containing protein [Archaeoglobaceae archaeon]MDW7989535.1 DUF996 domain-containing protein [Archaeoglobaceae archaeon]
MTSRVAKFLGSIGSLLMFAWLFLPHLGGAIAVVGSVLLLLAVKQISNATKDLTIFRNYFVAFILFLVVIIFSSAIFLTISITDIRNMDLESLEALVLLFLPIIIVIWIFSIMSAIFLRKSFKKIAEKTRVDLFKTAANVFLVSSILIITFLGLFVLFIALLLQFMAFLSLPAESYFMEQNKNST